MLKSVFYTLEWAVKAENNQVAKYVDNFLKAFWKPNIDKVLRSMEYGYSGGEFIFKIKNNQIVFKAYKEFHPRDIRILTRGHEYVGMRVKQVEPTGDVDLYPPKGFWFAINREFGGWYGRSYLINVWEPYEKTAALYGNIESKM